MEHITSSEALFESVSRDGIDWVFIVRSDDQWTITRDGKEVRTGDRRSAAAGITQFMKFSRGIANSTSGCSAAVSKQLDRIERQKLAVLPREFGVPKSALQCAHI